MGLPQGPVSPAPTPRKPAMAGTPVAACRRPLVPPDRGRPSPSARWTRPGGLLAPAVGRSLAPDPVRRARSQTQREDCAEALSPGPRLRLPPEQRSEEHTSELQSLTNLVCRLLLEKKKECDSAADD